MSDRDDAVRILAKDVKFQGWSSLTVYTAEVRRRDGGRERLVREIESHGNSVAVLPHDAARGTVLLVRQFRLAAHLNGHRGWLTEVCAGMIDAGETAEAAILREAREELGYQLRNLQRVADAFVSPGASTERSTMFLAAYSPADRVSAGGGVDHGEDIEVTEMPLAEAVRGIADGTIVDAKTIILLQAAELASHR
jgi:nudix-type nucleoside diphosphatase (YffH/AdpP family)